MNLETLLSLLEESPESLPYLLNSTVEKYKPIIYSLCGALFTMWKDLANNKDYFSTEAVFNKNQYDAYIEAGFNEDQAMMLLLRDKINIQDAIKNTKIDFKKG